MYLDVHVAPHEVKIVPASSGPIECISEGNTEFIESKIQVYQLYRSFDEFLLLDRAPVSQCNSHATNFRWTLDTYIPQSEGITGGGLWG